MGLLPSRSGGFNAGHTSRPVQAGNSGASTTERLRRLAPSAGSLQGDLSRLFPFTVFCKNQIHCNRCFPVCQPPLFRDNLPPGG